MKDRAKRMGWCIVSIALTASIGSFTERAAAQVPAYERGTVGAGLSLRRLDGFKRVLMIGAHPDDEDTSLLAALSRGWGVETAYLALTRGDGGQNLIGPELWEGLGAVRTGELVAARNLDGGRQFFTRAFDFGYSKSAAEALAFWPREELLRDVTWVVRTFRPHVIVSVFSGTPSDGHGQHQAAGIMAGEVFEVAGDPSRFPDFERLGVSPWQPTKLYRLARGGVSGDVVEIPTGTFDPLIGRSHFQLAMESRSQHRSQDMGASQALGPRVSRVALDRVATGVDQDAAAGGFFAAVDTSLAGVFEPFPVTATAASESAAEYRAAIREASEALNLVRPESSIEPLMRASDALSELESVARVGGEATAALRSDLAARRAELQDALMDAAGVVYEVRVMDDLVVPGESVEVSVQVWNGGPFTLSAVGIVLDLPGGWGAAAAPPRPSGGGRGGFGGFFGRGGGLSEADPTVSVDLEAGQALQWRYQVQVPDNASLSRPYYLESGRDGEMYRWPDRSDAWGLPNNPDPVAAILSFALVADGGRVSIEARGRGEYVGVDPALGEFRTPVHVVPALSVRTQPEVLIWPVGAEGARTVSLALRGFAEDGVNGEVSLEAPPGWVVEPASAAFAFEGASEEQAFSFRVRPQSSDLEAGNYAFGAIARTADGDVYDEYVQLVDYPHIDRVPLFTDSEATVEVVPLEVAPDLRVAYVMGTGDRGVEALAEIGIAADVLSTAEVLEGDYSDYDVVVLGIRAYETREDLRAANGRLLDFARAGGTVIVQYNQYQFANGGYAPYTVDISRPHDRVTDQDSPFRLIDPESPVFNSPNRIGSEDFEGWVTERGLYFLGEWAEPFTPLLELTDPGEDPKRGALVAAPVGEGVYAYVGLSLFRQLPAGVPGAYRLLANLVSLTGESWRAHHGDGGFDH